MEVIMAPEFLPKASFLQGWFRGFIPLLIALIACTPEANRSPIISSFSAEPSTGSTPLQVKFHWAVSDPDGDSMRATLIGGPGSCNATLISDTSHTWACTIASHGPFPQRFEITLLVEDEMYTCVETYYGRRCYTVNKGGQAQASLQLEVTAANETLKWQLQLGDAYPYAPSPAIALGGTVYAGSMENGTAYLNAINPTGTLKWRYPTLRLGWEANPAIATDGTVYVLSQNNSLKAIKPDGTLLWIALNVLTAPAIAADGTLYVGSSEPYLYAIDPNGSLKWRFGVEGQVVSDPVVAADGTIYLDTRRADPSSGLLHLLYTLNPSGTLKWSQKIFWNPLALGSDGSVYSCLGALSALGVITWGGTSPTCLGLPVLSGDGSLYYVEAGLPSLVARASSDGRVKWSFPSAGVSTRSTPTVGADGVVYIGFADGYLYAIQKDGTLKKGYFLGGEPSSAAIAPDGTVYVQAAGYLYALESTSLGLDASGWPRLRHDNQNTGRVEAPNQ
jgi:outer membrane protein assembly factor BamB